MRCETMIYRKTTWSRTWPVSSFAQFLCLKYLIPPQKLRLERSDTIEANQPALPWPRHSISEPEKSFIGERHGSEKKKITAPIMSKPQVMAAASFSRTEVAFCECGAGTCRNMLKKRCVNLDLSLSNSIYIYISISISLSIYTYIYYYGG